MTKPKGDRVVGIYYNKNRDRYEVRAIIEGKSKHYYRSTKANAERYAAELRDRIAGKAPSELKVTEASEWGAILKEAAILALRDGNYREIAKLADSAAKFPDPIMNLPSITNLEEASDQELFDLAMQFSSGKEAPAAKSEKGSSPKTKPS